MRPHPADDDDLSSGVLPDVLMTMRQKIESLTLFDSDMMRLATNQEDDDPMWQESRESLKRSSQQSISAAVLVSLAHKRYERRRLGAMEIEKMVRSLVQQNELDRVRAILLLLSDDYVRSTSEDARKGGVVALAACAIGLKKAHDTDAAVQECRDLILASVVHACQDHSQRVRYYATESLFNVVKVIPSLAVQHFFILFEILRSLYADVDADVRSGAELLDKKLKEVIVIAMNSGSFTADSCVPVFARFVHMRNKATKRLTLTWLQELNEKLIGAPILEFLHLFLGGIFDMVADPTVAIRQSALAFLQSVLPKLLVMNSEAIDDMDDQGMKVDFDKILQSLVTSMEHPSPFVRKVAMYWMSRIVKAHMSAKPRPTEIVNPDGSFNPREKEEPTPLSPASVSVLNSLPHVLPGILLR
jgi:vacuole morphology and inheritance protein 14